MSKNIDIYNSIFDEIISLSKTLNSIGLYIANLEENFPSEHYDSFSSPLLKSESSILEAQGVLEQLNTRLRNIWISKVMDTPEPKPNQWLSSVVVHVGADAKPQVSWTK